MAAHPKVLAIVLAGGEGKRLQPLTSDRAKPAVPFGGTYRLIDFVLSNLVNASMRQIAVLTQYKSHSLDRHISLTWRMSTMLGNFVTPVPAQQRLGPRWYQGSADAIFQSMNLITDEDPDYVVVFGADNIYRMDVEQMLDAHIDGGLGATVAGIRVPRTQASAFGVIDAAADNKIEQFLEKPVDPPGLPDDPEASFASMGNYIFTCDALVEALYADAENLDSRHDMGGDIIPYFVGQGQGQVYDFT
ncbi:MAG TPA: sugar phosphate nucleotidyltransferase, partial [Propionibacteriaceae bacterium]|nr:sugar phosphate nucleotidyltransferase [Propionibacteriaceae bacterium]